MAYECVCGAKTKGLLCNLACQTYNDRIRKEAIVPPVTIPIIIKKVNLHNRTQQFWDEHAEWSQKIFGTDEERGPLGALKHLEKEAREAQNEVNGVRGNYKLHEEISDCLFLTLDAARRAGMTLDCLLDVAFTKLAKNKTRVWNKPNGDEPVEHVRGIND